MAKLLEVPGLRPLLPFVRVWQDEAGNFHEIRQHEGGEQGDPLMPLLFSLAIHNALNEAKQEMWDGEELFAFLDDVYIVSSPERTRHLYNLVAEKLRSVAGIQLHTRKIRMEGVLPTWSIWVLKSGAHKESRCYERQLGRSSSSRKLVTDGLRRSSVSGTRSLGSPTCSARGKSFCSAPDPDATVLWSMPLATTWACNARWTRCWEDSLGTRHKSRRRRRWRRSP